VIYERSLMVNNVTADLSFFAGELMLEKLVGGCIVFICLLFSGFLALASFFAIMDGKDDEYLDVLGVGGVSLVIIGLVFMLRLARPKPVKPQSNEDEDMGGEQAPTALWSCWGHSRGVR
jgi:hypothetical protein